MGSGHIHASRPSVIALQQSHGQALTQDLHPDYDTKCLPLKLPGTTWMRKDKHEACNTYSAAKSGYGGGIGLPVH